jgi:hypothetical protein
MLEDRSSISVGLASSNAYGTALRAHIAVYKACDERECPDEVIFMAVHDGVDIISLSIGGSLMPMYDHDLIDMTSFASMQAGVLVIANVGNDGTSPSTVQNDVPWLIIVA